MANKPQTHFDKDVSRKTIIVKRNFEAPLEDVWRAWTESELLDQWWAPKPWRAETKQMDFREGGYWLYAMVGPEQERHYARMNFNRIEPMKRVEASDIFCDENGNENKELPGMDWTSEFTQAGSETLVKVTLLFATEEDLDKMLAMGFEEGFSSALGNLDQYLASRFQ